VAGAQAGHAESALGRGLGLTLVILVRAVKGRWQVSAPAGRARFVFRA